MYKKGLKRRERVHCLADAYTFAHGLELSPQSLLMFLSWAVMLEQKHMHTLFISECVGVQISPASLGRI